MESDAFELYQYDSEDEFDDTEYYREEIPSPNSLQSSSLLTDIPNPSPNRFSYLPQEIVEHIMRYGYINENTSGMIDRRMDTVYNKLKREQYLHHYQLAEKIGYHAIDRQSIDLHKPLTETDFLKMMRGLGAIHSKYRSHKYDYYLLKTRYYDPHYDDGNIDSYVVVEGYIMTKKQYIDFIMLLLQRGYILKNFVYKL